MIDQGPTWYHPLCCFCVEVVETGQFLLGQWFSFVHPASTSGTCAAWSFGSDSLICRNANEIGCLDLSCVMVASDVHRYFLCPPLGCMLNHTSHPVEVWSYNLLLADGIWVKVMWVTSGKKPVRVMYLVTLHSNCSVSEGKSSVSLSVLNHTS